MGKIMEALAALEAMASLVTHTTSRMRQVSTMIEQANAEGRDLSSAEVDQVRAASREAMERLRGAG